jgi:hypothetical protein
MFGCVMEKVNLRRTLLDCYYESMRFYFQDSRYESLQVWMRENNTNTGIVIDTPM